MVSSLGTRPVQYHPDRPVFHFASTAEDVEHALTLSALRKQGFETTKEVPR
jgi:hypothetical protein